MKRATLIFGLAYFLLLVAGAVLMHSRFNTHWLVTLFLFSPRWVVMLPMLVLIPFTLLVRWRWSWIYFLHGWVILVPILGYQWSDSTAERPAPPDPNQVLRVLTCNVGSGQLDQEKLKGLIRDHQIQIVMLQECPPSKSNPLFRSLQWPHHQAYTLAIGSALPMSNPVVLAKHPRTRRAAAAIACDFQWPSGAGENEHVKVVAVHLPTFRPAFEKFLRLEVNGGSTALSEVAVKYHLVVDQFHGPLKDSSVPLILGGDFNVPIESVHYRDYWCDFQNAHSVAGSGLGYTKSTRHHGIRIDHILADAHWTITRSWVGPNLGGDHRPVIAELVKRPPHREVSSSGDDTR